MREKVKCSPKFAALWKAAEASPGYWLELVLLRVEEDQYEPAAEIKAAKRHGRLIPEAFWSGQQGKVDGLEMARKHIKRAIREYRKTRGKS